MTVTVYDSRVGNVLWQGRLEDPQASTASSQPVDSARDAPCEQTWPSDTPSRAEGTYRQHRCARTATPGHQHVCRYCAATKEA